MSFGGSVFSVGFNQKTIKKDISVKGNHVYLQRYLRGKTLEDSRRLSTEVDPMPQQCGASRPHLQASQPVGPSCQPPIATSVLYRL
jgi:hypothetical protein